MFGYDDVSVVLVVGDGLRDWDEAASTVIGPPPTLAASFSTRPEAYGLKVEKKFAQTMYPLWRRIIRQQQTRFGDGDAFLSTCVALMRRLHAHGMIEPYEAGRLTAFAGIGPHMFGYIALWDWSGRTFAPFGGVNAFKLPLERGKRLTFAGMIAVSTPIFACDSAPALISYLCARVKVVSRG